MQARLDLRQRGDVRVGGQRAGAGDQQQGDTLARGTAGRRPRILRRSGAPAAFGLISWRDHGLAVDCHDFAGDRLSNHSLTAPDPYAGAAGLAAAVEHDLECELTQTHGIPVVMDNDANLAALGDSTQASVSERATSST